MGKKSLTGYAKRNIREIHALSRKYNGKNGRHTRKILSMVGEHAEEIARLHGKKDPHFFTEVGDLVILCLELLLEQRKDADKIMDRCYRRFRKKFSTLLLKTSR